MCVCVYVCVCVCVCVYECTRVRLHVVCVCTCACMHSVVHVCSTHDWYTACVLPSWVLYVLVSMAYDSLLHTKCTSWVECLCESHCNALYWYWTHCCSIYKRWHQLYTSYNGEEQLNPLDTDGYANLEASLPNSYIIDAMDELRVSGHTLSQFMCLSNMFTVYLFVKPVLRLLTVFNTRLYSDLKSTLYATEAIWCLHYRAYTFN